MIGVLLKLFRLEESYSRRDSILDYLSSSHYCRAVKHVCFKFHKRAV